MTLRQTVIISMAEYFAANTNHIASLLNSNMIIIRHAHTQGIETEIGSKPFRFQLLKNRVQQLKLASYLRFVIGEGGHPHQPTDTDIFQSGKCAGLKQIEKLPL